MDLSSHSEKKTNCVTGNNLNLVMPTLGGKQFWTDQFVFRDWRIQQNVFTRHCRLLDSNNFRQAWGSFNACRRKFESIKNIKSIQPLSGKAMVLLHGLGRTRGSMAKLARHFQAKGHIPINIEYASTRAPIREHARALNRILGQLEGIEEIRFVGHSMGNIVFRYYLKEFTNPKTGVQGDCRIQSSVMVAPPNNGTHVGRVLKPTGLFGLVTGPSGTELASDWKKFSENLAIPDHRFGIVAGKYNGNPLFRVDNDTTVSIDETKLPGAHDFQITESMHSFITSHPKVIEGIDRFFSHGYFETEEKRTPLP